VAEPISVSLEAPAVFTREQMEDILVAKLIATSAKQIGMFLRHRWPSVERWPSSPSSSTP